MKNLKKYLYIAVFFAFVNTLFALDIEASINAGVIPFNSKGKTGNIPDFGFKLVLNENLGKNISGTLAVQRDLYIGNTVWGRVSYTTELISISIGPTLSVFNAGLDNKNITNLIHPGLGSSFSVQLPIGFFTSLDTNFPIPLATSKTKNVYLYDGFFDVGWRFSNIIASIKISQKNKSIVENSDEVHLSATDLGFYTIAYSKPSRIRIPLNIIYRINHFQKANEINEKIGNIVVETGVEHALSADIKWFINAGTSVFSFYLTQKGSPVKKIFYKAEAGVKISINWYMKTKIL